MFTVGLVDQITKPIAKISHAMNNLTNNYQAGTMKMASGVGGIAASGMALQSALMPAIEMDRALGEVKSLGVRDSALKQLTDTSYEYALKYGKSATDFISSSYDIQSAIDGLNDADLSAFTLSSNVLAAATKADAGTITNYMGTMYGIFKNEANAMGKSEWVEQVTGMTATAVQAFKTTGAEMSGAFTAIGAQATSAGIAMNEQMAILGTLQSTMSGSEAGTKYKSFLAGVGKAQDALNLKFTDSQGAMLPMVDILNQIKGKYGETLDVAESDELAKAFGSQEAVATVKLLMTDINGLNNSIETLGKVKGMSKAEEMAAAMTDQSERLSQSWYVIRAALGSAVLPAFNSFVGWLADMGRDVIRFTEEFPNLTRYLGYTAMAFTGLVMAGGAMTVMMGAGTMAMTAWNAVSMVSLFISKRIIAQMTLANLGMLIFKGTVYSFIAVTKLWHAAQWALNLVMSLNPVGLVAIAIYAAIAAVGALIYYWDDLKATMMEWGWVKSLIEMINWVIDKLSLIGIDVEPISLEVETAQQMPFSPLLPETPEPIKQTVETVQASNVVPYVFGQAPMPPELEPTNQAVATAKQTAEVIQFVPADVSTPATPELAPMQQVIETAHAPMPAAKELAPMQQVIETVQQTADIVPFVPKVDAPAIASPASLNNESLASTITPSINQQAAAGAKAASAMNVSDQSQSKSYNIDVVIQNPPKNFSLAELADQQELMFG